jgi:hypothetical protein
MTLQELSDIAQIISSGAVIVSLVYLAIQIRQNTIQMRANSRIERLTLQENFVATQQEMVVRVAENPELYRIWRVAWTADDSISDEDRDRLGMLLYSHMCRYYMTFQASDVEPLEQGRTLVQIDFFAPLPAFQSWWQRQNRFFGFDPRFVALVDDRIARARAASSAENPNAEPSAGRSAF